MVYICLHLLERLLVLAVAVRVRGLLRRLRCVQLELKKGGATSKDCSWGLTITADGSLLASLSFLELFHSQ